MAQFVQPPGIAPGIYFNLSNEDYHADPALSHSGMTKLLMSWQDFWVNSIHNPERRAWEQTDAMKFGERSGLLLLQPEKFHQQYNTYGKTTTARKGVWISSVEYTKLNESIEGITEVEIGRDHFMHGHAEVSIFWKDPGTGVNLRAKIDYLRTFGVIDFKRIKAVDRWSIGNAVKAQGLDIQAFVYLEAVKAARAMLQALPPKGLSDLAKREGVTTEWLTAFMNDTTLLFRFLFQRSTSPYIWKFRELEDDVMVEGAHATDAAIRRYISGIEKFGLGRPPMGEDTVDKISQYHVPRRDYDYDQA